MVAFTTKLCQFLMCHYVDAQLLVDCRITYHYLTGSQSMACLQRDNAEIIFCAIVYF